MKSFKSEVGDMIMGKDRIMKFTNGVYQTANKDEIKILEDTEGVTVITKAEAENAQTQTEKEVQQ